MQRVSNKIKQHHGRMLPCRVQNFVENFSEFSAAQRNAGKHVTIMSELSRLVDARTLMQVCLMDMVPCPVHAYVFSL